MNVFITGWKFLLFIGGGPGTACYRTARARGKPDAKTVKMSLQGVKL